MKKHFFVNERIYAREIRVIDREGQQVGIMNRDEALRKARGEDLDLVMVAPEAKPPVCRIIDFGKFRYEIEKKEKEARKGHHGGILKEIKIKPKIGEHDFQVRIKKVDELLRQGYKVKVMVLFRGREAAHPEFGERLIERMLAALQGIANVENKVERVGKNIILTLVPKHA